MAFEKFPTKCQMTIHHLPTGKTWKSPVAPIVDNDALEAAYNMCKLATNVDVEYFQFNVENNLKTHMYFPRGILQQCIIHLIEISN